MTRIGPRKENLKATHGWSKMRSSVIRKIAVTASIVLGCALVIMVKSMKHSNEIVGEDEGWRDVTIPSAQINMSIVDAIRTIEKLADDAGAGDRGFRGIEVAESLLEKKEGKLMLSLEDVPLVKLLDFVSLQIGGVWEDVGGVIMIVPYAPPVEYSFFVNKNMLDGLGLSDRRPWGEGDIIKAFSALEVNFVPSEVAVTGNVVKVNAAKNKVEYAEAVVMILSRGFRIVDSR
jgi:hypothetical protein